MFDDLIAHKPHYHFASMSGAKIVKPLMSPRLPGHDKWEDLTPENKQVVNKNRYVLETTGDKRQQLKILRTIERRTKIIEFLRETGHKVTSQTISDRMSIPQSTINHDLVEFNTWK